MPLKSKTIITSLTQQSIWTSDQLPQTRAIYNIAFPLRLKGSVNTTALEQAFLQLIQRHESLRTEFRYDTELDQVEQVILSKTQSPFSIIDVVKPASINGLMQAEMMTPFQLDQASLCRAMLLQVKGDDAVLVITLHHIIADGWSLGILARELSAYYNHFAHGQDLSLPPMPLQYADYSLWQREYLQGEVLQAELNYWQGHLASRPAELTLPLDYPRPAELSYHGAHEKTVLDTSLSDAIQQLARDQHCTLFMVLLAALNVVLHRYTQEEQIVVGTVMANRPRHELEGLIGCFVNTLALNHQVRGEDTFIALLQQVKETVLEAQDHQSIPFEQLVNHLNIERRLNQNPAFQVLFVLQNNERMAWDFQGVTVEPIDIDSPTAKFDLSIYAHVTTAGQIAFDVEYATDLFKSETIARFVTHFQQVLMGIAADPTQTIASLPLLTIEERQQQLIEWNQTEAVYTDDETLQTLFEKQVAKTPDHIALILEDESFTYRQLNVQANQLARHLRQVYYSKTGSALDSDTLIPICVDRSLAMLVGLLAIVKAGGAYVPIDPTYPDDRIRYILKDTHSTVLISQSSLCEKLLTLKPELSCIAVDKQPYRDEPAENLPSYSGADDLVYVIYTSGTTGKPKGVMIEHCQFINFIINFKKQSVISSLKKLSFLSLTNYTFDIFGLEYALPLLHGGQVHLANYASLKKQHFHSCNIIQQTPSILEKICEQFSDKLSHILCLVGGEPLQFNIARLLLKSFKQIINLYGPTETVIWSSHKVISKEREHILIGCTLPGEKAYVLDNTLNPVPIGAIGELYVGGAGVSRGYLNQSELTQERFIPNPFATEQDQAKGYTRLYKTGDLVRWLPDGQLEYIGRRDFQVKIRGFRIELGEIEATLRQQEAIKDAVVLAKETRSGDKQLMAYVIPTVFDPEQEAQQVLAQTLRQALAKILPNYMVPTAIISLEAFPLTVNGKLDRRALPKPSIQGRLTNYIEPRTAIEKQLAVIWSELLGIEQVGITDDFFENLGGNSIIAVALINKMKLVGLNISVIQIFMYRSINGLLKANNLYEISDSLIVRMSYSSKVKRSLFMIHSSEGGCEVYHKLVLSLKNNFNCVGINNFNLISKDKIDDLKKIAELYLEQIKLINETSQPIYLLGWSLGGKVALEIAGILEAEGYTDITVYLLDTYLPSDKISINEDIITYEGNMVKKGFDRSYISSALTAFPATCQLLKANLNAKLVVTNVILFKAAFVPDTEMGVNAITDNNLTPYCNNLKIHPAQGSHWDMPYLDYFVDHELRILTKELMEATRLALREQSLFSSVTAASNFKDGNEVASVSKFTVQ